MDETKEYSVEDLRRITGAKSVSRIRNILCRPEFEKKRSIYPRIGRKLVYNFTSTDLQEFKKEFGLCILCRQRGM